MPRVRKKVDAALDELFLQVLAWGGVITGEHGIGLAKERWWPQATSRVSRAVHHAIKAALDPQGLLNPGQVREMTAQPSACAVLGIPLAVTDYAGAVAQAKAWAVEGRLPRLIAAANTHVVTLARHDSAFGKALATFDLVLPDGMPLVWVMNRRLPQPLPDRVYGPTFMLHCLEATCGEEWSHMFLGGSKELLGALSEKLAARLPRSAHRRNLCAALRRMARARKTSGSSPASAIRARASSGSVSAVPNRSCGWRETKIGSQTPCIRA